MTRQRGLIRCKSSSACKPSIARRDYLGSCRWRGHVFYSDKSQPASFKGRTVSTHAENCTKKLSFDLPNLISGESPPIAVNTIITVGVPVRTVVHGRSGTTLPKQRTASP